MMRWCRIALAGLAAVVTNSGWRVAGAPAYEVPQSAASPGVAAAVMSDKAVAYLSGDRTKATLASLPPSAALLKGTPASDAVKDQFVLAHEAPAIDFALLPGQAVGHRLWSTWGDAVHGADGMFYGSIGDHDSPFGSTFVYRVNPKTKEVKLVVDVNKVMGNPSGKYTGGKIHCPLVEDGRGRLYFATYRGSAKGTSIEYGYQGDHFFRYDEHSGQTEDLGPLVPDATIPVLVYYAPTDMLYGEAQPALNNNGESGSIFFAYSLKEKKLRFTCPTGSAMTRAIVVAADGRVFWEHVKEDTKVEPAVKTETGRKPAAKQLAGKKPVVKKPIRLRNSNLGRYDPKSNTAAVTDVTIPGNGTLRAASRWDSQGTVYCLTSDGMLFDFDTRREKLTPWKSCFPTGALYTAVIKLDPTERYLYYVPASHGHSSETGSVVVQAEIATRKIKAMAFPAATIQEKFGYHLGGTFGTALSPDGSQLFIVWNGNIKGASRQTDFGLCSAMILHIPAADRSGAVPPIDREDN